MADMHGFETEGELAGVCNYLRSHGGFEIKQVTNLDTYRGGVPVGANQSIVIGWSDKQLVACRLLLVT